MHPSLSRFQHCKVGDRAGLELMSTNIYGSTGSRIPVKQGRWQRYRSLAEPVRRKGRPALRRSSIAESERGHVRGRTHQPFIHCDARESIGNREQYVLPRRYQIGWDVWPKMNEIWAVQHVLSRHANATLESVKPLALGNVP
jgi:hypothetical protein